MAAAKKKTLRERFDALLVAMRDVERELLAALRGNGGAPYIDEGTRREIEAVAAKATAARETAERS